ncbi:hypothetical protein HELRODRAFT_84805, partial [Helobdella robusta]|uniref:MD-2-related lipid-recognition domain-containing protein n=1 Tax=Helobdella robusta TaxID=6412 RepID=T1G5N8_HELRO
VKRVVIPGCETTDICILTRGHNASFEIDFIPSETVSSATAVVHGIIDHIPVPFGIDNPNACVKSGLTCPLEAGKFYTYTTTLFIKEQYPALRLIVKWELQDSAKKDILCILLGAEIR